MSALHVEPIIRVNAATLQQHVGKSVLVVGTLEGPPGSKLVFTASDKQVVQVLNAHLPATPARFVEIVGKVNADKSVLVHEVHPLSDSFDLDSYNELVTLSASFPNIF